MACGTSLGQINNEGTFAYGNFDTVTIWNRLHDIGATWQVFWQETYFPVEDDDNKGWTQKAFPKVVPITALDSFAPMSEFHRLARMGRLPAFSFIEPSWTIQGKLFDRERGLQGDEMHPPGDVRPAEDLVGQIYTSLTARLSAWKNTLLVITFDEHGGLFDHWGPPSNAVPPDTNTKDFDFKRLGGRVPTIFASPWIEEKTVVRAENPPTATRWFDHTSIPATVLKWKGLQPAEFGLGDRTKGAPSFEAVLNRTTPRPRGDVILGPKRTRPRASYVWMYDEFCLKYVTEGKYENWYLGPAYQESGIYYPTLREEATQGVRLSFTLGDLGGRDPVRQPLVHGSFVYVRSMESQLPDQTWHLASLDKNYDSPTQPYCRYAKDGNRSYVYWTVKLADPATAVVGQNIHFGDEVFIENRYVPSFSYWLPGRLVPSDVGILYTYLSFSEDKDYDMPSRVGRWRIEFPPNSARAGKGR
jgi:phospholipase C